MVLRRSGIQLSGQQLVQLGAVAQRHHDFQVKPPIRRGAAERSHLSDLGRMVVRQRHVLRIRRSGLEHQNRRARQNGQCECRPTASTGDPMMSDHIDDLSYDRDSALTEPESLEKIQR